MTDKNASTVFRRRRGETAPSAEADAVRRVRVAVLGEFSAGKSTFINLVVGGKAMHTQVTATQRPAVWMSHGTEQPYRVTVDGERLPVDAKNLGAVTVEDTAYIRVFMQRPILELCDLIDTPGNSDPNIASLAWERIADIADVAVWCSPSTQAWRQSEAAAWSGVPERLRTNSVLLLTRADKLASAEDREKVLRRVRTEAGALFGSIHMASLMDLNTVRPALRAVVEMCRSIDPGRTPGPLETAHVLRGMDGETSGKPSNARQGGATSKPAEARLAAEQAEPPEPGAATALWIELTRNLPPDDPDALEIAFTQFLSRLDREIGTLKGMARIGRKGVRA